MEADQLSNQSVPSVVSVQECNDSAGKKTVNPVSSPAMASNSFSALTASYSKYGSEEQLVNEGDDCNETEDDEEQLEDEEYEFVHIGGNKHLHFVTDSQLSSWSDPSRLFESSTTIGRLRESIRKVVEHFALRIFSLFLVLVDIILVIVDLATNITDEPDKEAPFQIVTIMITTFFLLELMLRLFALGTHFFKRWLEIIDMIVVLVSFVVSVVVASLTLNQHRYLKLLVALRFIRILLFIRIVTTKAHLEKATRRMVSQNKRRYKKDGFDLDLTYVTERVIAMSFPSSGKHKLYRNPISEVVRFLDLKHAGHYKVYNMCSERGYDPAKFHNRVERILIDDHNVPRLSQLLYFCHNVKEWLTKDPRNIIAVHCKGGKGRTGTGVCAWLIYNREMEKAAQSLEYFGIRRTDYTEGKTYQGVQTPSQSRYVNYLEKIVKELNGRLPQPVSLRLKSIKIDGIGSVGSGDGRDLRFEIIFNGSVVYQLELKHARSGQVQHFQELDKLIISFSESEMSLMTGDIKMKFYSSSSSVPKAYDYCAFFFWFHTSFIDNNRLFLRREELDNPHKPKYWKVYGENFGVDLTFIRA